MKLAPERRVKARCLISKAGRLHSAHMRGIRPANVPCCPGRQKLFELRKQRLRFFQILGAEALGEPVVDGLERLAGRSVPRIPGSLRPCTTAAARADARPGTARATARIDATTADVASGAPVASSKPEHRPPAIPGRFRVRRADGVGALRPAGAPSSSG